MTLRFPCGPQGFAGGTNILYRNRGDGTFADVSQESGIARPSGPSSRFFPLAEIGSPRVLRYGAAAADFDNDGVDGYLRRVRQRSEVCSTTITMMGTFREIAVPADAPWTRMVLPCREWAWP